ncbi:MAG: tRNA pseudouridine(55) synthase TruB [Candidatus Promineifilaceae bacterium]
MIGFLLVDKPANASSHDVIRHLRRVTGIRRIGHAGTLDPLATGLLVVAVGRAARLLEYAQGLSKRYRAVVRLGQSTLSYDAETAVVTKRPFAHITPRQIEEALANFRGDILQKPPAYSAIKRDGQPLYKLARKGVEVEVESRPVTIYTLSLLDIHLPDVVLDVQCSSGTYIRSLAHDLGEALGCGGHLTALRRTAVGAFTVEQAVPLAALTAETWHMHLLPLDTAVFHLPRLNVTSEETTCLLLGQTIPQSTQHTTGQIARVYSPDGRFLGIVTAVEAQWKPKKMFPDDSKD